MSMIRLSLSLFLLVTYVESIKWRQCGGKDTVLLKKFDITPHPVRAGKTILLTFEAESLKILTGSAIKIGVKRKTFLGLIPLPCIYHFGTCTYHDSCGLLSRMKNENWGGKMADVVIQIESILSQHNNTLKCPVPLQKLSFNKVPLKLPTLSHTAALIAGGDYQMKFSTVDRRTGKTGFCLIWDMTIKV